MGSVSAPGGGGGARGDPFAHTEEVGGGSTVEVVPPNDTHWSVEYCGGSDDKNSTGNVIEMDLSDATGAFTVAQTYGAGDPGHMNGAQYPTCENGVVHPVIRNEGCYTGMALISGRFES